MALEYPKIYKVKRNNNLDPHDNLVVSPRAGFAVSHDDNLVVSPRAGFAVKHK